MTIRIEHPEFHASVAEVRRTASSLSEARARASGQVADLLDAWHGAAAEAFAEAWTSWRSSSAAVVAGLDGLAGSLSRFHLDVTTCDDDVTCTLGDLTRRLS